MGSLMPGWDTPRPGEMPEDLKEHEYDNIADPSLRKLKELQRKSVGAADAGRDGAGGFDGAVGSPKGGEGLASRRSVPHPGRRVSTESGSPNRALSPRAPGSPGRPHSLHMDAHAGDVSAEGGEAGDAEEGEDDTGDVEEGDKAKGGKWWARMDSAGLNDRVREEELEESDPHHRSKTGNVVGKFTPQFTEYHFQRSDADGAHEGGVHEGAGKE